MVLVLHVNFISCQVGFVLSCLYARATILVLCHGENGKPFCLPELSPCNCTNTYVACIDRSDSLTFLQSCHLCVASKKMKEILFWFHTLHWKITSAPQKAKHFSGRFMAADDSIKWWWAHLGITGWEGSFQNPGVCLQVFSYHFSAPHSCSFTGAIFGVVFHSCSLLFAPNLHGTACYAG